MTCNSMSLPSIKIDPAAPRECALLLNPPPRRKVLINEQQGMINAQQGMRNSSLGKKGCHRVGRKAPLSQALCNFLRSRALQLLRRLWRRRRICKCPLLAFRTRRWRRQSRQSSLFLQGHSRRNNKLHLQMPIKSQVVMVAAMFLCSSLFCRWSTNF